LVTLEHALLKVNGQLAVVGGERFRGTRSVNPYLVKARCADVPELVMVSYARSAIALEVVVPCFLGRTRQREKSIESDKHRYNKFHGKPHR
jgi:hypothetical protein